MICNSTKVNSRDTIVLPLKGTDFSVEISDDINCIQYEWDSLNINDVFLSTGFLKSIQESSPSGIENYYLLVKDFEDKYVGCLLFQFKRVKLSESIKKIENSSKRKDLALKLVNFNMLVNGNLTVTGDHGSFFTDDISTETREKIIYKSTSVLSKYLKGNGKKISSILRKDYYDRKPELISNKYLEVQVEPNMIFDIRDHWKSMDDYLIDLKSKYRVRYKRTRKKINPEIKRELSLADLEKYEGRMNELYLNVVEQANFNLFYLPKNYFTTLAKNLDYKFKCYGYFVEDELEAFMTVIDNYDCLDAHFLGYNPKLNSPMHLYANILYDIVDLGISDNYKSIAFSRTASEIKSSAGAVAHDMNIYVKATNPLFNQFLKRGFNYFDTTLEEWQPRSPFKD